MSDSDVTIAYIPQGVTNRTMYRTIIRNIISNWANIVLNVVIGFALMPFIIHKVGDGIYGIWVLVISLTGYGGLFDFGIRSSVIKYVSEYNAKQDQKTLNDILSSSVVFFVLIGLVVAVLTIVFAYFFPRLFHINPSMEGSSIVALCLVGIGVALKFPFSVFESFISGFQRYEITNGILMAMSLLRTFLIIVFLSYGYKLIALALIALVCDLCGGILALIFCLRLMPELRINLRKIHRPTLRKLFGYGVYGFIILLSMRIMYQTDSIVIGIYLPAEMITIYAVAGNLIRYVMLVANGYGNVFNPAASALQALSDDRKIHDLLIRGTKFSLIIMLPMILSCLLLGKEFISLWMGKTYEEQSGKVLFILAFAHLFSMSQYAAKAILFGINKHKFLALVTLVQAFVNIVLSVILVKRWGIYGVAVGTAIPEILVGMIVYPWFICRITKLQIKRYLTEAFSFAFAGGVVFALVLMILNRTVGHGSWVVLVGKGLSGMLCYCVACYFMCLNAGEQNSIRMKLVSILPKAPIA